MSFYTHNLLVLYFVRKNLSNFYHLSTYLQPLRKWNSSIYWRIVDVSLLCPTKMQFEIENRCNVSDRGTGFSANSTKQTGYWWILFYDSESMQFNYRKKQSIRKCTTEFGYMRVQNASFTVLAGHFAVVLRSYISDKISSCMTLSHSVRIYTLTHIITPRRLSSIVCFASIFWFNRQ